MKKPLKVPKFKNEHEERKFWSHMSLADFANPKDLKRVSFPNLKPTSRSISIRLPLGIINQIKVQANAIDVPYQALMKQYLAKGAFPEKA